MWVTNYGDGTVSRIDATTDKVTATYKVGTRPCGVVFVDGRLWVGLVADEAVAEVDPSTGRLLRSINLDGQVYDVQAGYGSVWVNDYAGGDVVRIDPVAGKVLATIPTGTKLYGLAVTEDGVWAADVTSGDVVRIDPATNKVTDRVHVAAGAPFTFAHDVSALWVTTAGATSRLDPRTGRAVATIGFGATVQAPGDPDALGGFVYVPDGDDGSLAKIDGRTNRVVGTLVLGHGYEVAQAGFGAIWDCNFLGSTIARVTPSAAPFK
jgi:YVTN family beta-propeller protein